ncbi:SGNH/GDSL hydrolase family protein [Engelhardtia mirabilis]|uniref:SGNH hydrolase-type esterase domain-containing protein n=1 Tax=Engelhardtia mirabilis TaxID=2528011 RepID=A0A518BMU0_9BACT|nr:hypothetical protein Pla133_33950 [Planctomycetes bacterium Pla133]QDV02625.1 hypothetical protein Pla86_33940 [Planctomycetes bacterium Pla86]
MAVSHERIWRRWALSVTGVAAGLVVALWWLALREDDVRGRAVADMVATSGGIWDAARDPDVTRLLQPGLEGREHMGVSITSNRFGLREREYALPKPNGVFRVVLLGDSFVFGYGAEAQVRLGNVLERELTARQIGAKVPVECLHLALGSWNLQSECAFLRRQLDLLAPDVVVHVSVSNDLDDTAGARGFGAMADVSPQRPDQRGLVLRSDWPRTRMGSAQTGYLPIGLDWESTRRFDEAARDIADLSGRVEAGGGTYLHVLHWGRLTPIGARFVVTELAPSDWVVIPGSFYDDRANWVTADDAHWGEEGHRRVATAVYGELARAGAFERLELEPWPEASAEAEALFTAGAAEAAQVPAVGDLLAGQPIDPLLDREALAGPRAWQVHGGVESDGTLGPYASMILARSGGRAVAAEVEGLGRASLARVGLTLWVDDVAVASGELAADGELRLAASLPEAALGKAFLTVRLTADDYVYAGEDLRRLASARLVRVAIE